MDNAPTKLHPLLLVAATSVTVASLAAIASFTGLLPGNSPPVTESTASSPTPQMSTLTPPPLTASVPSQAPMQAPAASLTPPGERKPVKERHSTPATRPASPSLAAAGEGSLPPPPPVGNRVASEGAPTSAAGPVSPPICRECGTVENVHEVKAQAEGSGLGAIAGGVLGGLLGNQMGGGKGRDATTVVGALGGAYAGHQVEKNVRGEKYVQVTVRFDDGTTRTYKEQDASRWQRGDRVRLRDGSLLPI